MMKRTESSRPLPKNPLRRRVLAYVSKHPGKNVGEIAESLKVSRTTASYHLNGLVQFRWVTTTSHGRSKLHFPIGHLQPVERNLVAALRRQVAREILERIYASPRLSWRQIARSLEVTPRTVRWHVSNLEEQGLIHVMPIPEGRRHHVYLHPTIRSVLRNGGFDDFQDQTSKHLMLEHEPMLRSKH